MRVRRKTRRRRGRAAGSRWREACVDGVLHAAFVAAERAESAAERCVPSGMRPHHGRRGRHRRPRWR